MNCQNTTWRVRRKYSHLSIHSNGWICISTNTEPLQQIQPQWNPENTLGSNVGSWAVFSCCPIAPQLSLLHSNFYVKTFRNKTTRVLFKICFDFLTQRLLKKSFSCVLLTLLIMYKTADFSRVYFAQYFAHSRMTTGQNNSLYLINFYWTMIYKECSVYVDCIISYMWNCIIINIVLSWINNNLRR